MSTKDEYDSSGPHTHVHYKHLFLNILIISKHLQNGECSHWQVRLYSFLCPQMPINYCKSTILALAQPENKDHNLLQTPLKRQVH